MAADAIEAAGVKAAGFFMVGYLGETDESLARTISFSSRLPLASLGLAHNVYPRDDLSTATTTLPPSEAAKLKRREAAHVNGLENFPLFAAAMIVGNDAGLDSGTLNLCGVGYLVCRGVYSWLYVTVTKEKTSYARYDAVRGRGLSWGLMGRTAFWWIGNAFCVYPLIKAANVLAGR